ncbi:fused MFS/spermidine synthase [candidate division KSB1 bacterium]|nr:fused MFS/spermidine synthase [candidate division KSB1 bacterium]
MENSDHSETMKFQKTILALFFISGACGLIYETAWIRLLNHIYGSTVYATSTILAAFMGGLALGSYYFGKRIDQNQNPLKIYAYLELGIALFALLSPFLLGTLNPLYLWIYRHFASIPAIYLLLLFSATFLLLLIPTFLMGGTLPVLSRLFIDRREILGQKVGNLYALNTFGAMLGCWATGFILIGLLGIKGTIFLAASLNLAIFGIIIFVIPSPPFTAPAVVAATPNLKAKKPKTEPPRTFWIVLLAFAISGFTALGYEVVWFRGLVFYLGNSTWAFTTMLTTILGGIAVGSLLIRKLSDRRRDLILIFGGIEMIIGLGAAVTIWLLGGIFHQPGVGDFMALVSRHWLIKIGGIFLIAAVVMFIPAVFMGMTFPLVSRIGVTDLKLVGHKIGEIYAINTVGAIAGSIITGFALIPWFGILNTIWLLMIINLIIGETIIFLNLKKKSSLKFGFVGLVLIGMGFLYLVLPRSIKFRSDFESKADQLLFYREDVVATTAVFQKSNGPKLMSVDGHTIGGTESHINMKQKLLAHLPLLLSPAPRHVFVVGLGSGITLGSIQLYPEVTQIDVAEIVPGVIEGARYFAAENRHALADPRVKMILGDGVHYLKNTPRRYDVISSDAKLNPEYVGNTVVLSEEYYQICRERLNPNGIFCQWIAFDMPEPEYQSIVKTLTSIFPYAQLWYFGWTESLFIGTCEKPRLDLLTFTERMNRPVIFTELGEINLENPYVFLSAFLLDQSQLVPYAAKASLNTWNRPFIEFNAPRHFANLDRNRALPLRLEKLLQAAGNFEAYLISDKRNALGKAQTDANLVFYAHLNQQHLRKALGIETATASTNDAVPQLAPALQKEFESSLQLLEAGQNQAAIDRLKNLALKSGRAVAIQSKLGYAYLTAGRPENAIAVLKQALTDAPDYVESYDLLALAYQQLGKLPDAINVYRQLLAQQPQNATAHYNLGVIYHTLGQLELEREAYLRALTLKPDYPLALFNLGIWYGNKGQFAAAIDAFQKLVAIEPENYQGRYNLALALQKNQQSDLAQFHYARASSSEAKARQTQKNQGAATDHGSPANPQMPPIRLSHILVKNRTEAAEILTQIQQGQNFAELARQRSLDPSATRGGDLGFLQVTDLMPEFQAAVQPLKVGQVSEILTTKLGYHIFLRTQ